MQGSGAFAAYTTSGAAAVVPSAPRGAPGALLLRGLQLKEWNGLTHRNALSFWNGLSDHSIPSHSKNLS